MPRSVTEWVLVSLDTTDDMQRRKNSLWWDNADCLSASRNIQVPSHLSPTNPTPKSFPDQLISPFGKGVPMYCLCRNWMIYYYFLVLFTLHYGANSCLPGAQPKFFPLADYSAPIWECQSQNSDHIDDHEGLLFKIAIHKPNYSFQRKWDQHSRYTNHPCGTPCASKRTSLGTSVNSKQES